MKRSVIRPRGVEKRHGPPRCNRHVLQWLLSSSEGDRNANQCGADNDHYKTR
jgi:hypothetical protein